MDKHEIVRSTTTEHNLRYNWRRNQTLIVNINHVLIIRSTIFENTFIYIFINSFPL